MRNLCLFALLALFGLTANAQKKAKAPNFTEGVITYTVQVEGAPEAERFVNNTQILFTLKEMNFNLDVSAMNGFAKFNLLHNETDKVSTLLMNVPMFAEKVAIPFKEDDAVLKKFQDEAKKNEAAKSVELEYVKGGKRIAKHRCRIAELRTGGQTVRIYTTDKIRLPKNNLTRDQDNKLEGFPLGFEMELEGVKVRVFASSVEKKAIEAKHFETPNDYNVKSLEEFQQEMEEQFGNNSGIGL